MIVVRQVVRVEVGVGVAVGLGQGVGAVATCGFVHCRDLHFQSLPRCQQLGQSVLFEELGVMGDLCRGGEGGWDGVLIGGNERGCW